MASLNEYLRASNLQYEAIQLPPTPPPPLTAAAAATVVFVDRLHLYQ